MPAEKIIKCDKCKRVLSEFWYVFGHSGTYDRPCALQISLGNEKLIRSAAVSAAPEDPDSEVLI